MTVVAVCYRVPSGVARLDGRLVRPNASGMVPAASSRPYAKPRLTDLAAPIPATTPETTLAERDAEEAGQPTAATRLHEGAAGLPRAGWPV